MNNIFRVPSQVASADPMWPLKFPPKEMRDRNPEHHELSAARTGNMCTPHPKLSFVVTRLFRQPQSRYDYACQSDATPRRRRIWNAVDGHGSALPSQCLCAGSTGKAGSFWNSVPCLTKTLEEHFLRYDVLCRCGQKYHWKYRFRPWQNKSSFDAKYPC